MKKRILILSLTAIMGLLVVAPAGAGEWRIPVGFSYVGGASAFLDQIEESLENDENVDTDGFIWPVGISTQPYYEFDFGLGLGFGIGPLVLVTGDADAFILPINASLRYAILPWAKVTPYVRAGFSHIFAGGDYVEGSSPGLVGALGVEFLRHKRVGVGVEIGLDAATVEMENYRRNGERDGSEDVKAVGLILSIQAIF